MRRFERWLVIGGLFAAGWVLVRSLWPFEILLAGIVLLAFVGSLAGMGRLVRMERTDRSAVLGLAIGGAIGLSVVTAMALTIAPGACARVWGAPTTGRVSSVIRNDSSKRFRSAYLVRYTFEADGREVAGEARAEALEAAGLQPGDAVEIRYFAAVPVFSALTLSRGSRPLDVTAYLVLASFPWMLIAENSFGRSGRRWRRTRRGRRIA